LKDTIEKVYNLASSRDIVERTFDFAANIIGLVDKLDGESLSMRVLSKQVLRSGTSVGANVEEAQAAESRADFIHKYNIALKEARETKYWLRLLATRGVVKNTDLGSLIRESDEICRIIAQIVINARKGK